MGDRGSSRAFFAGAELDYMDMKLAPTGTLINLILAIGISVATVLLGAAALETVTDGAYRYRKKIRKYGPSSKLQDRRSGTNMASLEKGKLRDMNDFSCEPCGRSLTVQDIAVSFHYALFDTSNNMLARKAFKSMPLLLIYNGRRSEYITKMRVILISYFMHLFDRTIFNVSLCVEACRAIQMLCVIQSGQLAHNYNSTLLDAGAIEAVSAVLHIHMPTGSDNFLNISLVTRGISRFDENVKRHIFEFLYCSDENAVVAELSCSVLGRLCNHTDITRDYSSVLNAIVLALAAHVANDQVAIQAFSAIFNCRLVKLSSHITDKTAGSLYNSLIASLVLYKTDSKIVIMCCQIITDLFDRTLKLISTQICDAIVICMRAQSHTKNIRGGVFDTLCDTALYISKNNENITEKIQDLNFYGIIGEYDSSLSLTRFTELQQLQKKFVL